MSKFKKENRKIKTDLDPKALNNQLIIELINKYSLKNSNFNNYCK